MLAQVTAAAQVLLGFLCRLLSSHFPDCRSREKWDLQGSSLLTWPLESLGMSTCLRFELSDELMGHKETFSVGTLLVQEYHLLARLARFLECSLSVTQWS